MKPELGPIVKENAALFNLPFEVVLSMVHVESGGNARATRHEPAFQARYIKPLNLADAGEELGRATSWGLLQIMGQTAREIGFKGDFEQLLSPADGLYWGCKFLARLRKKYPSEPWRVICRAYNGGPGNRHDTKNHYPDKVEAAMRRIFGHGFTDEN